MRPVVGITGPNRGGAAAWMMTSSAIARAGGKPERLTPGCKIAQRPLDALVLGGGADLDPTLYGDTEAEVLARRVDRDRDSFEIDVLQRALERSIPVLGICRGAQLINIHRGGTLYGDIAELYVEVPHLRSLWPKKEVRIEPSSQLREVLGTDRCWVNALHHQAIRTLGSGIKIVAWDDAGVVQAIEIPSSGFCIGVQWHPEYLPQHKRQRALFGALVHAARSHAREPTHP